MRHLSQNLTHAGWGTLLISSAQTFAGAKEGNGRYYINRCSLPAALHRTLGDTLLGDASEKAQHVSPHAGGSLDNEDLARAQKRRRQTRVNLLHSRQTKRKKVWNDEGWTRQDKLRQAMIFKSAGNGVKIIR